MITVGFLSAVRHADSYIDIFANDPRVRVVGVSEYADAAEWKLADSRRIAERYGVPFLSPDELLADPDCDVIVVCSEPTRHAELAIRALQADKHVLIDKPLAVTTAEADAIIEAERASRGTATVINRLHSPAIRRLRRWVDEGHFGLPRHVDIEWFASGAFFSTSVERPELVTDVALSGGGEILNFLLYPIDYLSHLTGLQVVEAYAEASTLFQSTHAEAGVEDTAVVSLLLEHGVTATITLGRVASAPGHGPVSSSVRLIGSRGFATADDDQPAVSIFGTDGAQRRSTIGGASSEAIVRSFLTAYIDRLELGAAPEYTVRQARETLRVVEACAEAARTGLPTILIHKQPEEG
ncbi:Gfo/Idh/MocA family protein [Microterricola viridarii]|uniref:Predicted dehydrogenase n=1 Tax=Microterricola viridarii TaxID=412690 RepID=A0A1H1TJE4_9MICO|nr:Gfo/Idh/MocA family oxidoreductase [Microterricola viridarii]SDS60435.1 Predicted dehydrogenase [Microterricola viridarii]